jgi:MFS family permease
MLGGLDLSKKYADQLSLTGSILLSSPLYIAVFIMRFSFGLVLFTLPIYLPKAEFSNLAVGVIAAAYPVTETIFGPVVGILSDRYGRRMWIYIGLSISTLILFAFTLSTDIPYLVAIHALQGVAAAMIVVSSLTLVTDVSTIRTRGREMGVYDFANLGGYIAGILVAGILLRTHFSLVPFYFASGLAAAGAIYAFFMVKEKTKVRKETALPPIKTMSLLLRDRRTAAMFPIWLSVTTFIGMALTFGPRLGPSPMITSFLIGGTVLILAFTQPFFGQLSDKYGRDRLMMLGMLSLIGLFVTLIVMLRGRHELIVAAPFLLVFGLGSFAFAPAALATLGDYAPEMGRGTTMGLYSVVISFGTAIGPLLGGYLLDHYGFDSLLYAGLIMLIVALGLAIGMAGTDFRRTALP